VQPEDGRPQRRGVALRLKDVEEQGLFHACIRDRFAIGDVSGNLDAGKNGLEETPAGLNRVRRGAGRAGTSAGLGTRGRHQDRGQ
jgi:hypothetical protein